MDIGKMVAAELERQGRKVEWLAHQLPCDKSNMYKLLKKPNWDVAMLIKICLKLKQTLYPISQKLSHCVVEM